MCGRYGSWTGDTVLAERFGATTWPETEELRPSWNRAPGADVRVLIERPLSPDQRAALSAPVPDGAHGTDGASDTSAADRPAPPDDPEAPVRQLRAARWGLLPVWAKDAKAGFRAFNARSETAASKPTFRASMRSFRALVPADCWYEWQRPATGPDGEALTRAEANRLKRPYAVSRADEAPLALAGLCSWWRLPGAPEDLPEDPDEAAALVTLPEGVRPGPSLHGPWLLTCSILTRAARSDLDWLHDREPVVLRDEDVDAWLDPALRDGDDATALLAGPRPPLRWWEVGSAVGSTRSDGAQLVTPLDPAAIVSQA